MTVAVIELADADGARAHYTRLLEHAVSLGTPREVRQLAAEAFVCENTIWGACLGLWQDEFVAWGCTTGEVSEAEAIMRLVASEIRITRPLPHLDGGG